MSNASTAGGSFRGSQRTKISVPLRPFTKGVVRNVAPTMIPIGAVYDANGFLPSTSGLVRRSGFGLTKSIDILDVDRYDYIDSFINDDGTKTTYAIADGKFYELAGSIFTNRPCAYISIDELPATATISATVDTNDVIGVNTNFGSQQLKTGDILLVDPGGTERRYTVDQIIDDLNFTTLEIIAPAIVTEAFAIERVLYPAPEWQIQVKRIDRVLYICTGQRPLMGYNIDTPERVYPIDVDRPFVPKTIEVIHDRLWCGNIFIPLVMSTPTPSRWYTNRVSWSWTIPESGYTPTTTGAVDIDPFRDFNDLVETGGEISALSTLGSYLAVFFEYGVHYGRLTQVPGDILPLAFDAINTGERGVLQPGAVTTSRNGLFFVSTDTVYFLGENLQLQSISESINELLFRPAGDPDNPGILNTRYKINNVTEVEGLIIGCGYNEDSYNEFWLFNFTTKAWTRFLYACAYFNVFTIGSRLIISQYLDGQIFGVEPPGQNDDALGNPLPDSPVLTTPVPVQPPEDLPQFPLSAYTEQNAIFAGEGGIQSDDRLFATVGQFIVAMDATLETDQNDAPIHCQIETGDFDFGRPDQNKTLYKVSLRLFNQAPADILYHVQGSLDSGETWWDLCDLNIFAGGKEGKSNFQFTGSAPRLRLTSNTVCTQYEIIEATIDVKGRGKQFSDT